MKKINLIKFLFIILTLNIFMFSCTKENIEPVNNTNTGISADDLAIYNKIISFKNKIKEIKNNNGVITKITLQPLDLDSAIWYLEAATNFTEADANIEYNNYEIDSAFITIQVSHEKIDWLELEIAYYAISDSLNIIYNNISEENKQLKIMDISLKENTPNNVILKMTTIITKTAFTTKSTTSDGPFGFVDWWMWGEERGKCNNFSGNGDASNQIEYKANQTIASPANSYATNVETITVVAGEVPRPSPVTTNYGSSDDYLYWEYNSDPNYPGACFSPKDMNLFYNGLLHIETLYRPTGKVIEHYFLGDYRDGFSTYIDHYAQLTYCIWHTNPTGGGGQ